MNIFILDSDHKKCAKFHNNKHIVKMPLETAQLLCSVHHLSNTNKNIIPYRLTHKNHPASIWCRTSLSNYNWLIKLGKQLCYEYTYRYNKRHKCQDVIEWCENNKPNLKDIGLTKFAQCMPDQYKHEDAVKAYREYYIKDKKHLAAWKNRNIPRWYK